MGLELPPPLLCFVGGAAAGIVGPAGLLFEHELQRAGPCLFCLRWFSGLVLVVVWTGSGGLNP